MDAFDVVDWRRRTFAIYAEARAAADPADGHARWVAGRDELFASHPASPLVPDRRAAFTGLPVPAYDPAWRFEVDVTPAEPEEWPVETGTDGTVVFERIGVADLGAPGSLTVWRLTSYGGGVFVPVKDAGWDGRAAATAAGATCWTRSRAPTSALTADGWSWTSTSPTRRRVRTTPGGPARWRPRGTCCAWTCRWES